MKALSKVIIALPRVGFYFVKEKILGLKAKK